MTSVPVSREELYGLVWSEPMTKVAARYEVSSSFLARVCARLNVPRPPRGYWASPETYVTGTKRKPPSIRELLHQATYPYVMPVAWAASQNLESASLALSRAFSRLHVVVRYGLIGFAGLAFIVAATTPLSLGQQLVVLAAMWILTMLVRQLTGYGPAIILMSISVLASS